MKEAPFRERPFIVALKERLLQRALAAWPRRGASFLVINCADGAYLPLLWHAGFDVTAIEPDASLRESAQKLAGQFPGLELQGGCAEALPFEDQSFDCALLVPKSGAKLGKSLDEAARVAARGILIAFWNSFSLPLIFLRLRRRPKPAPVLNWWRVWRRAHRLCLERGGTLSSLSILGAPPATWHDACPLAPLNTWLVRIPWGAWCVLRCDFSRPRAVTPLGLRLERRLRQPEPVLEYLPKREGGRLPR